MGDRDGGGTGDGHPAPKAYKDNDFGGTEDGADDYGADPNNEKGGGRGTPNWPYGDGTAGCGGDGCRLLFQEGYGFPLEVGD